MSLQCARATWSDPKNNHGHSFFCFNNALLQENEQEGSRLLHRWVQLDKADLPLVRAAFTATGPAPAEHQDGEIPASQQSDATAASLERELSKMVEEKLNENVETETEVEQNIAATKAKPEAQDETGDDGVDTAKGAAGEAALAEGQPHSDGHSRDSGRSDAEASAPSMPDVLKIQEADPVPAQVFKKDARDACVSHGRIDIEPSPHEQGAAPNQVQREGATLIAGGESGADGEKINANVLLKDPPVHAASASVEAAASKPAQQKSEPTGPRDSKAGRTTSSTQELPMSFFVDPQRNRKIVRSMAEAFMFESDCIETLWDEEGEGKVQELIDALANDTMSTAFSGIEAAGTSMQVLRKAIAELTGASIPRQKILYQIEWNKDCQSELLPMAKKHGTCLFANIALFYRDELRPTIEQCLKKPQMTVEVLGPLISSKKAMKLEAPCLTHGKVCSLQHSRRHMAGTSCKLWSRKGLGLGCCDPEIVFTLAWVGLRVMIEDDEVVSENVQSPGSNAPGDDAIDQGVVNAGLGSLLLRFLAPMYFMETTMLDPSMIGEPFSRQREFVKMRHKGKCIAQCSPVSRFQKRFFRACQWSWKSVGLSLALA
eukprot:s1306_g7.t1